MKLRNQPSPHTSLPRAVWILSWVSFFADISSEMIYPLLPLFLVGVLGASKTELGLIEGAAVLIVSIMGAVAGFKSDKTSNRIPWIRWGYGLPMIGKALIAVATVWPLVLFGRMLDRFGKGLRSSPRDALIANAVGSEQRGRAFGLHRAFDTAGALVGVLLSAFLLWWLTELSQNNSQELNYVATPGWVFRVIFAIGAALGIVSLFLTFAVSELKPELNNSGLKKIKNQIRSVEHSSFSSMPRRYWLILGVLSLFSLANSSDTFILLHANGLGYSPGTVVLMYALYNFTYSLLSYPLGTLSDRIGRWGILKMGWAIYALVYFGFASLSKSFSWTLWPLMATYGVYMAFTDGVGKALIADVAPEEKRGAAMGIFYGVTGITSLAANLLAGSFWDKYGPQPTFLFAAVFSVIALAVISLVPSKTLK